MKTLYTLSLFILLALSASIPAACAAPVTAVPATIVPTSAPTAIPPTATSIPPTVKPTGTSEPTNTPAPVLDKDADKTVRAAFAKFQAETAFRFDARNEFSPIFFEGKYTPAPGDDPNKLTLFAIKGEQKGADLHYAVTGFIASFIGLRSGFDPDSNTLEIANVGGTLYMRGTLANETQARWYSIPANQAESMRFTPQDVIAPILQADYPDRAFTKTGTQTLGTRSCNVYTATRAAFDAVFPLLVQAASLSQETLALDSIDRSELKIWVCADGNLYGIRYNLDAHAKTDASKKGSLAFDIDITDYDTDIVIQAPADAVPLPADATGTQTAPAVPLTATPVTTPAAFTSLDGEWEGASGTDNPLKFTVENNKITFALVNYSINTGGCSFGGAYGSSVDDGAITNRSFSVVLTNSDDVKFTFAGKFNSNNDAAGTLQIKGKTFCGGTDAQASWTAKHLSSPESPTSEPTEEPTVIPTDVPTVAPTPKPTVTATPQSASGAEIVKQVFAALARQDIEGALGFLSDDVVYTIGTTSGVGKDNLRSNLQLAMTFGTTFQVSNLQDLGGIVTFTAQASGFGGGTFSNSSVIVHDGKIVILTIK
jgi:hypothetical protein